MTDRPLRAGEGAAMVGAAQARIAAKTPECLDLAGTRAWLAREEGADVAVEVHAVGVTSGAPVACWIGRLGTAREVHKPDRSAPDLAEGTAWSVGDGSFWIGVSTFYRAELLYVDRRQVLAINQLLYSSPLALRIIKLAAITDGRAEPSH